MTIHAEYQRALQEQYIKGRSVPELLDNARRLVQQIEDTDEFLGIRVDALVMVARTLEASYRKFNAPEVWRVRAREELISRWLGRLEAGKGEAVPAEGDDRDCWHCGLHERFDDGRCRGCGRYYNEVIDADLGLPDLPPHPWHGEEVAGDA